MQNYGWGVGGAIARSGGRPAFLGWQGCPGIDRERRPFADGREGPGGVKCGATVTSGAWNADNHASYGWWLRQDQRLFSGYADPNLGDGIAIWQRDHNLTADGGGGRDTKASWLQALRAELPNLAEHLRRGDGIAALWNTLYLPELAAAYPAGAKPPDAPGGDAHGNGVIIPPQPGPSPAPPPGPGPLPGPTPGPVAKKKGSFVLAFLFAIAGAWLLLRKRGQGGGFRLRRSPRRR